MNRSQERALWTAYVEGKPLVQNKYGNKRRGKYASKHEADIAGQLWTLERDGQIQDLKEQVPFLLVMGREKVRPITYVADFTYTLEGIGLIVCDAKGFKTPVYKIKKKLMYLLLGITILEL
jgi:Protein of unknown function (DUF1064)